MPLRGARRVPQPIEDSDPVGRNPSAPSASLRLLLSASHPARRLPDPVGVFPRLAPPLSDRTIVVHTGVMSAANKTVRQSVSLPASVAAKVRTLAKTRTLSSNRMLVELIENRIEP